MIKKQQNVARVVLVRVVGQRRFVPVPELMVMPERTCNEKHAGDRWLWASICEHSDQNRSPDRMPHQDRALAHGLHFLQDDAFPGLVIGIFLVRHGGVANLVVFAEFAAKASREFRIIPVSAFAGALNQKNLLCHCGPPGKRVAVIIRTRQPRKLGAEPPVSRCRANFNSATTCVRRVAKSTKNAGQPAHIPPRPALGANLNCATAKRTTTSTVWIKSQRRVRRWQPSRSEDCVRQRRPHLMSRARASPDVPDLMASSRRRFTGMITISV